MSTMHTGHIWINAPFTQLPAFLQHYLHCKQMFPDATSACILIPGYLLPALKSLLSGMRLLKRFTKGSALFEQVSITLVNQSPLLVHNGLSVSILMCPVMHMPFLRTMQPFTEWLHHAKLSTSASDSASSDADEHLAMLFEGTCSGANGAQLSCLCFWILELLPPLSALGS